MDQVHHCVPLSLEPPSEEEMAKWLYPIVRGEVEPVTSMDQPACGDIVDGTAEDGQLVLASMNTTLKAGVNCTEVCIFVEMLPLLVRCQFINSPSDLKLPVS